MKIILHIGNGKTGTSSIQETLIASEALLSQHGIRFLGFMLDQAPVHVARWQRKGVNPNIAMAELTSASREVASEQIAEALRKNVSALEDAGIRTAIWSNERFFNFPQLFIGPLQELARRGHEVEVVAYVRRHDQWVKSVHNQWNIKRKRNAGVNISFREFIESYKVSYAPPLRQWDEAFGAALRLRNFDTVSDAVMDFSDVVGIDPAILVHSRTNDTPGPEETVLRVLFNDRLGTWTEGAVDSIAFDRLIKPKLLDFTLDPVAMTNDLLPSADDLQRVVELTRADQAEVNAMLAARGEPALDFSPRPVRPVEADPSVLRSVMFQILTQQAREIQLLKAEVARIGKLREERAEKRA